MVLIEDSEQVLRNPVWAATKIVQWTETHRGQNAKENELFQKRTFVLKRQMSSEFHSITHKTHLNVLCQTIARARIQEKGWDRKDNIELHHSQEPEEGVQKGQTGQHCLLRDNLLKAMLSKTGLSRQAANRTAFLFNISCTFLAFWMVLRILSLQGKSERDRWLGWNWSLTTVTFSPSHGVSRLNTSVQTNTDLERIQFTAMAGKKKKINFPAKKVLSCWAYQRRSGTI